MAHHSADLSFKNRLFLGMLVLVIVYNSEMQPACVSTCCFSQACRTTSCRYSRYGFFHHIGKPRPGQNEPSSLLDTGSPVQKVLHTRWFSACCMARSETHQNPRSLVRLFISLGAVKSTLGIVCGVSPPDPYSLLKKPAS